MYDKETKNKVMTNDSLHDQVESSMKLVIIRKESLGLHAGKKIHTNNMTNRVAAASIPIVITPPPSDIKV